MSVRQTNGIEVECPNDHRVLVPTEDWEHEIIEVDDKSEHGMGNETHHRYFIDGYCCPQCDADIDAGVDVWEYPEGEIETTDKSSNVVDDVGNSFVVQLN